MKKIIVILVALMLTLSVAYAEEMSGTWRLVAIEVGDVTMNPVALGVEGAVAFGEEGTVHVVLRGVETDLTVVEEEGVRYLYSGDWKIGSVIKPVDEFLKIGTEEDALWMIFARESKEDVSIGKSVAVWNISDFNREEEVSIGKPVKAGTISDFNGDYVVTYISVEGYTLEASAMNQIFTNGLTTNEIKIAEGVVELMGEDGATYTLTEIGTLTKISETRNTPLDVMIYKLEDGGIGVYYLGITFFAQPVTETVTD